MNQTMKQVMDKKRVRVTPIKNYYTAKDRKGVTRCLSAHEWSEINDITVDNIRARAKRKKDNTGHGEMTLEMVVGTDDLPFRRQGGKKLLPTEKQTQKVNEFLKLGLGRR